MPIRFPAGKVCLGLWAIRLSWVVSGRLPITTAFPAPVPPTRSTPDISTPFVDLALLVRSQNPVVNAVQ